MISSHDADATAHHADVTSLCASADVTAHDADADAHNGAGGDGC